MPVVDPLILVRGLHLAATVLASGTVAFGVLVAGPALRETNADGGELLARRLTMLVWTALAVAILSGWAWLTLIAANILDVPPFDVWRDGAIWPVITGIRYGQIACLRLVAALLLTVSLALPPRLPGLQAAQLAVVTVLAGSLRRMNCATLRVPGSSRPTSRKNEVAVPMVLTTVTRVT